MTSAWKIPSTFFGKYSGSCWCTITLSLATKGSTVQAIRSTQPFLENMKPHCDCELHPEDSNPNCKTHTHTHTMIQRMTVLHLLMYIINMSNCNGWFSICLHDFFPFFLEKVWMSVWMCYCNWMHVTQINAPQQCAWQKWKRKKAIWIVHATLWLTVMCS